MSFLRLAEMLTSSLSRLRAAVEALDVGERRRISRFLAKEPLLDDNAIIIRHVILVQHSSFGGVEARSRCSIPERQQTLSFAFRAC
jgi:hypothetical protein